MSTRSASHRPPAFMTRTRTRPQIATAAFAGLGGDEPEVGNPQPGAPVSVVRGESAANVGAAPAAVFALVPPSELRPPPAVALERQMAELASRVELSVERLRASGERLAAEARADALELALVVARRIVEVELTVNIEAQVSFIRTAIRRLGEARTVSVRLCPAQAAAVGAPDGPRAALDAATTARVEIVADPSLEPGDCVVDGDLASVDGRLTVRLDEIRRAVLTALAEEHA